MRTDKEVLPFIFDNQIIIWKSLILIISMFKYGLTDGWINYIQETFIDPWWRRFSMLCNEILIKVEMASYPSWIGHDK